MAPSPQTRPQPVDLHAESHPPGPFLNGQPDMSSAINKQWYENNDIYPEDPRWGRALNAQLELVEDSQGAAPGGYSEADADFQHQPLEPWLMPETEAEPVVDIRPPPPRPVCPLVSFAPNGQLLVMFPQYPRLSALSPVWLEDSNAGPPVAGESDASTPSTARPPRKDSCLDAEGDSDDNDDNDGSDANQVVARLAGRLARRASEDGLRQVLGLEATTEVDDTPQQDTLAQAFIPPTPVELDPSAATAGLVHLYDMSADVHSDLLAELELLGQGPAKAFRALRNTKSAHSAATHCQHQADRTPNGPLADVWRLLAACLELGSVPTPGATPGQLGAAPELLRVMAQAVLGGAEPSTSQPTAALAGEVALTAANHEKLVGLLAQGLREEALELCVAQEAWSHALVLASCQGAEAYKQTMLR